jgi:hypothetical protein
VRTSTAHGRAGACSPNDSPIAPALPRIAGLEEGLHWIGGNTLTMHVHFFLGRGKMRTGGAANAADFLLENGLANTQHAKYDGKIA